MSDWLRIMPSGRVHRVVGVPRHGRESYQRFACGRVILKWKLTDDYPRHAIHCDSCLSTLSDEDHDELMGALARSA